MALQRCIFQRSVQYFNKPCIFKPYKQSYCELRHIRFNSTKKFTDRHEWIIVDNNIGTVGISKYAQESLGDVVFAQLPEKGSKLTAGDECGALESVKAASEIYSPVSGIVEEKNSSVENKPGLINSSCYKDGWLFKIKITKPEELADLMSEDKYEEFLQSDKNVEAH